MTELWLRYKDANGEEKRVPVTAENFVVGRHSASDLHIPDSRLSREHVRIVRFGEVFVATDLGSSNGTTVNGEKLSEGLALRNEDKLGLGGLELVVEMISDQASSNGGAPPPVASGPDTPSVGGAGGAGGLGSTAGHPIASTSASSAGAGGIPTSLLFIAPLFGLIVLVLAGGMIFLLAKKPTDVAGAGNDFQYSKNGDDDEDPDPPANKKGDPDTPANTKTAAPSNGTSNSSGPSAGGDPPPPPTTLDDNGKTEQNGAAFLRRIAKNDPRAFMTAEQAKRVNTRIKQVSSNSAVADNINSARKNAAQIKSLAQSKNLKPQLLAVAAIAKLGTSRGDVLQAAVSMADVLDKLNTQIGSELADDSLLMIAAFDQGVAGDFLRMRNMLQDLATKFPESSRAIRSIWFLEKNGKLSSGEFDRALTFLAIGTITQNPKDFGVNAEALTL